MSETVHASEAPHEEHIHLPENSFWPLVLSGGIFVMLLGMGLSKQTPELFTLGEFNITAGNIGSWVGLVIFVVGMGGWITSVIRERVPSITPPIAGKMAMWMFLASEIMFFTGLIASFLLLRAQGGPGVDYALVSSIPLVSLNTFILLSSSLTVVLAHDAAVRDQQGKLKLLLLLSLILGTAFVSLQGVEYIHLVEEGLLWWKSGATGYGTAFYTLTGTHGLHVIIGLIWGAVVLFRALQGGFKNHNYGGVEIFGLYWHFVDIVWILLFTLVYLMNSSAGLPTK